MSQAVVKAGLRSFWVAVGSFGTAGLNFILMIFYARFLDPERLGSFVTSQSQVLIWLFLADLGLANGLVGVLTFSKEAKENPLPYLWRVLLLRIFGALLGVAIIGGLANSHGQSMRQDLAFTPYLVAMAMQQTVWSYLYFCGRQIAAANSNFLAVLLTSILNIYFVSHNFSLTTLLFCQAMSSVLCTIFMLLIVRFPEWRPLAPMQKKQVWKHLWQDSWPHAIIFTAITIWSRLDQIAASHFIDLKAAGIYGLAVRLVAVPVLAYSAVLLVLFPELQRLGRDAPEKINFYSGFMLKLLARFGAPLAMVILWTLGFCIAPLVPKFQPAVALLIWFAPGVWTYWLFGFTTNALLGHRRYRETCLSYGVSLVVYLLLLWPLTKMFGVIGIVLSYSAFNLILFMASYIYYCRVSQSSYFLLWQRFNQKEIALLASLRGHWLRF